MSWLGLVHPHHLHHAPNEDRQHAVTPILSLLACPFLPLIYSCNTILSSESASNYLNDGSKEQDEAHDDTAYHTSSSLMLLQVQEGVFCI
jgi:hypothetical protein